MRRFKGLLGSPAVCRLQDDDFVWHSVVYDFRHSSVEKKPVVRTAYFQSNMGNVLDAVVEKFEFLDEDDPCVIETALQDEYFNELLQRVFETGDKRNEKHFNTIATMCPFNGGKMPLLLFCCEEGHVECVKLLLSKYSTKTAPKEWLQLADPLFQDRAYGNSAFSVAAYRGDVKLFRVLWQWAEDHQCIPQVKNLRTKKYENLAEVAQRRIETVTSFPSASMQPINGYIEIFNLIAPAFGLSPKHVDVKMEQCLDEANSCIVMDSNEVTRTSYHISASTTLTELATFFEEHLPGTLTNTGVQILNVHIAYTNDDDAVRFIKSICTWQRISFRKCSTVPQVVIPLIRCAAEQLRSDSANWTLLALVPSIVGLEDDDQTRDELANAVESFLSATTETLEKNNIAGFEFPPGFKRNLPPSRRVIVDLFRVAFITKRLIHSLLAAAQTKAGAERLVTHSLSSDFTPHNPLLSAVAAIERYFLVKSHLAGAASSINDALNPMWEEYVFRTCDLLLTQMPLLSSWSARMRPDAATHIPLVYRLTDEAMLYVLKMRPSKSRDGIDIAPVVLKALRAHDWKKLVPKTAEYIYAKKIE
eukprot:GEMP01026684.1.p1 GENE.GEMP01026684.1~~GEMP01026684.1.p1  ORF type:complete len:589 (+),score=108.63 GEMP01026684.1:251-2017(+)